MLNRRGLALMIALALVLALLVPVTISAAPNAQPKIPHPVQGRENCTSCHQVGGPGAGAPGGTGTPANHASFTNAQCTGCHQLAAAAPAASPTAAPAASPTAAPAASPTAAPAAASPTARPAATAAASPTPAVAATALPKTGGAPILPFGIGAGAALVALGWGLRRWMRGQ